MLFTACEKPVEFVSETLRFNQSQLPECADATCAKVEATYPKFIGLSPAVDPLNAHIQKFLIASLYLGEGNTPSATSIEVAARQFIAASNDLKTEFDMELTYEAQLQVKEVFENTHLICLEEQSYLFTGGAHGYGSMHYKTFDLTTGDELSVESLFDDFAGFKSFAEQKFRVAKNIPEGASINDTGYWFKDDVFALPESLGLTNEGINLRYNQYDIASYADGPIEVLIPWSEIKPFLSKTYFE